MRVNLKTQGRLKVTTGVEGFVALKSEPYSPTACRRLVLAKMPDTHWQGGHEKVDNGDDCNAVTQYLVRTRVRQNGRHLKESVPAASHSPAPARNLLDCKIFHSPGSVPHSPVFGMLFCPPWCCGSGPLMSSATGEFYHGMPKNLGSHWPFVAPSGSTSPARSP